MVAFPFREADSTFAGLLKVFDYYPIHQSNLNLGSRVAATWRHSMSFEVHSVSFC